MSPVYWIILFVVLGMGALAQANPVMQRTHNNRYRLRPDKGAAFILSSVLILVSALRYWVGVDYGAYYRWNVTDWAAVWHDLVNYKEGGFSLLVKLSRTIWNDGQAIIITSAVITVGLYCWTIYENSSIYLISMLLYIFMGDWQGSFNGIRQYLAAAILFAGHRLILERKLWQYCLVLFIAGMFHTTALVMIIPYFLFTRKPNVSQLVLLAVGAVIIRFSYPLVFDIIGGYKGTVMDVGGDPYLTNSVNILRILAAFIPVVIYIFLGNKEDHTRETDFYLNALFFNAFSMLACMGSTYLARIGLYTQAAAVIGYGHLFQTISDEKSRSISIYLVLLLFVFYWIYSITAGGIASFHWIFERQG